MAKKATKKATAKLPKGVKPRVVEVSASLVGKGDASLGAIQRSEAIERVMNDAYNMGVSMGITDQKELLRLKMDALRTFRENET